MPRARRIRNGAAPRVFSFGNDAVSLSRAVGGLPARSGAFPPGRRSGTNLGTPSEQQCLRGREQGRGGTEVAPQASRHSDTTRQSRKQGKEEEEQVMNPAYGVIMWIIIGA